MTGHKGNREFCFPETLNVPRGEKETGPVFKCFVIFPNNSKIEKKSPKTFCLTSLYTLASLAKLSGFQNQAVLSKNHDNSLFIRG